jgi:DNA-binding CsgD family transcriptional regulator
MNARSDGAKRLTVLTDRRSQVATLASQGLSNRQIAEKLGVSEGTVKIHLHAIYEKLDIHTRAELKSALKSSEVWTLMVSFCCSSCDIKSSARFALIYRNNWGWGFAEAEGAPQQACRVKCHRQP